jgi:hypothetical protein
VRLVAILSVNSSVTQTAFAVCLTMNICGLIASPS